MSVQCAISDRPFTISDLPGLLPAVMVPCYDTVVPVVLGGEPVELPEHVPSSLPASAARRVAVVLAGQRAGHPPADTDAGGVADAGDAGVYVIDEVACGRLLGFLAQVADQRDPRGVRYPLPYLLAVPIVAMTAHETQMNGIGEWVADAPETLLLALGAPTGPDGRARRPDAKTITDVLAVHGQDYDRALCAFTGALARESHRHRHGALRRSLHVDGKAQKGAAPVGGRTPMLLAARFDDGTVAAQRPVPIDKTNEITVFAPLLDQLCDADLAGVVATADQLHTQRGHARYLHERGAFYVFTVGGNQPGLFAALDALPWQHIAVEHATVDRGHGRIEIRTIQTLPATNKIKTLFPHVAQVFLIERHLYDTSGTPLGSVAVLGITSLPPGQADGEAILAYVRGHWSIESLHWLRDRVLGEDDSKLKSASQAMAALRNLVISICCLPLCQAQVGHTRMKFPE